MRLDNKEGLKGIGKVIKRERKTRQLSLKDDNGRLKKGRDVEGEKNG